MIGILITMIVGIITGVLIHRKDHLVKINDRLITLAIYILLFLLGISVGLNKIIVQNIGNLGFQALIITIGAVSGSLLVSWVVYKVFFKEKQNINLQDEK